MGEAEALTNELRHGTATIASGEAAAGASAFAGRGPREARDE
jgi:hypothetical protein